MTRKYAIVPHDQPAGEIDGGEMVTFGWLMDKEGIGKMTRAQIELMAKAAHESLSRQETRQVGHFTPWERLLFFQRQNRIRAMATAVKAAGIEVEGTA